MSDPKAVSEALRQHVGCSSGEADEIQYLKFGIQMAYLIPFGSIYIAFLMKIVRKRKDKDMFEDSFFTLHLTDGVITIFFLVTDTAFFRLTSYFRPVCESFVALLKDPAYTLTPFYTVYLYAQLAKMLSTMAMSLNRYTSIVHPVHHKVFWMEHCTKILIAVFVVPCAFVWPVIIGTTSFSPFFGTAIINYERVVPWARTSYGRIIVAIPVLIFTIYSSIITSAKLRKLGGHMKKVEMSMNVATLFTICGFLLVMAVQFAYLSVSSETMVTNITLARVIFGATQISYDFYNLSGPVVLLILDKRMRSSIFCCRMPKKVESKKTAKISVQPFSTTMHSSSNKH